MTAADVDLEPRGANFGGIEPRMKRPPLARDVVRFAGDIVAVVLTESAAEGVDAAELVHVDYEPLHAVVDLEASLRGEVALFPEVGSNVCAQVPVAGDDSIFDGCEVVVRGRVVSQRMAPAPMEPRSTAAWFEDGRLHALLSTQTPHGDRDGIAEALGIDPPQVRVIGPDVGGGFGAKTLSTEDVIVAWLARHTGRPVRWTESRSENMLAIGHARAQRMDFTIGGSRDGKVEAYKLDVLHDAGAYPGVGAFLPMLTRWMQTGVYAIQQLAYESHSVVTNTTPTTAFRGAGRPEAAQAIERAIDAFAAEIGVDPAELRRRNFISADDFPFATLTGVTYDSGDYERSLDLALEAVGYDELRAEQARRRQAEEAKQLGIGISVYVEITNGGAEPEFGAVEITAEGGAVLRTGSFSHGQGHETAYAQVVADRLGLPLDQVSVRYGDTDDVARGGGTYGSKSLQIGGTAAAQAATRWSRRRAARRGGARGQPGRRCARPRRWPLPRHGRTRAFALLGRAGHASRLERHAGGARCRARLQAGVGHLPLRRARRGRRGRHRDRARPTCSGSSPSTTRARIISPTARRGPACTAASRRASRQALYEEFVYDPNGNPLTGNFVDYAFPSAAELPFVRARAHGDADPDERARRKGHRRVGDDRRDARRPQRSRRRARRARRAPRGHARERRERLARDPGRPCRVTSCCKADELAQMSWARMSWPR